MAISLYRIIFEKTMANFTSQDLKKIVNKYKKIKEILDLYEISQSKKSLYFNTTSTISFFNIYFKINFNLYLIVRNSIVNRIQ